MSLEFWLLPLRTGFPKLLDGFPTLLFPSSNFRAPIPQLYCRANIEGHHGWGEKCGLKKGEDGQNQEVWSGMCVQRAAGAWAGVLMLEGGFYRYI